MAIRRSIKEMWLGATLSTILHVGPIILLLVGLPVLTLAFSSDKKEPETVDTNSQAGARKAEAAAKIKSEKIEVTRDTAEGQSIEEKPLEDPGQSVPSIDIQIIPEINVPSTVQKIIEKQTAAINKSKQVQPDKTRSTLTPKTAKKQKPTPKTEDTSIDRTLPEKKPAEIAETKPPTPAKEANRKSDILPKTQAEKPNPSEVAPVVTKPPQPPKIDTPQSKPVELAQAPKPPAKKEPQQENAIEELSTKRGGGGADVTDNAGNGAAGTENR